MGQEIILHDLDEHFHRASLDQKFRFLTEEIAAQVARYGHSVSPYHGNKPEYFPQLDTSTQLAVLEGVVGYYNLCLQAQKNGYDLFDDKFSMVWWGLRQLGLRFPSDMFGYLEKGDVLEVYNRELKQVFRTFNIFFYLSYSLDEIFCHEWRQLYERDPSVTEKMFTMSNRVLTGEFEGVVFPSFEDHEVREIFSNRRRSAIMRHRFFAPLFSRTGKITAFASVFKIIDLEN